MAKWFFLYSVVLLTGFMFSCQPGPRDTRSGQTHAKTALWPDGTEIPPWFGDTAYTDPTTRLPQFSITSFGAVGDSATLNTAFIQVTIDSAAAAGGGVVVVPQGRFRTGALFFKPGVHLHLLEGALLLGSDNIADFPMMPSRMEGRSIDYFPAVINAYDCDGFSITGQGTIDGNGRKYWEAFWQRRKENPQCTNLEVSRPRLVFIQHSDSVLIRDVRLQNAGFWTTHLYKCHYARLINLNIFSPVEPVKAPSTDAIDLDACTHILVDHCYMEVNDDAIALKGGKGPYADTDSTNGPNQNILIRNCSFGFCHSAVTCGSEAIHNQNILVQNCTVNGPSRVLWLKMRPDTPQLYEYITVEGITGTADRLVYAKPWTQFFDLQGRTSPPPSISDHITFRNITLTCKIFADIERSEYDSLRNFTFENLDITAEKPTLDQNLFDGLSLTNVIVNGDTLTPQKIEED